MNIDLVPNLSITQIREQWQALYTRAQPNLFLSWNWIGNWLASLSKPYIVCIAYQDSKIVGMGILVERTVKRFGVINTRQILLHKSGDEKEDQTWIEYNDFLLDKSFANGARMHMVDAISERLQWDEFIHGASTKAAYCPFLLCDLAQRVLWQSHSYQVDLQYLRDHSVAYLSTLSKNTRYQIKRSLRSYQQYGDLTLSRAEDKETALLWFNEAAPLHIARWQNTDVGSGFTNPIFVDFHTNLIEQSFDDGLVDMLKVQAGEQTVCYLYNLIQNNEVKFYLSANNFSEQDKTLKPGLVAHYLAIQNYLQRGFDVYDFMAGESQYKRSLSSASSPIYLSSFRRKSTLTRVEQRLRAIKHKARYARKSSEKSSAITIYLTGGQLNIDAPPQYNSATLLKLEIRDGKASVNKRIHYQTPAHLRHEHTNQLFKAGSVHKQVLSVVTETEVLQYSLPHLEQVQHFSDPSFNDLHHVFVKGDELVISNTGQDAVSILDTKTQEIRHHKVLHNNALSRVEDDIDYRKIPSTKPHIAHANYAFMLQDNIWVTRCDLMDAVCLSDHNKRIHVGNNLIHDGVVYKDYIYFTDVGGNISVYNKDRHNLLNTTDLHELVPNLNGWCRGILPLSANQVIVGISAFRKSKKYTHQSGSYSRIILVDIFQHKIIWDINTSELGIDAIFSILAGGEK